MTIKELALAIVAALDDGFSSREEYAEGVLEVYEALMSHTAIWLFAKIGEELDEISEISAESEFAADREKELIKLYMEVRQYI